MKELWFDVDVFGEILLIYFFSAMFCFFEMTLVWNCSLLLRNKKNKEQNQDLFLLSEIITHFVRAFKKNPRITKMSKKQYVNYLAIQTLEEMGNDSPTQSAIDHVEAVLKKHFRSYLN